MKNLRLLIPFFLLVSMSALKAQESEVTGLMPDDYAKLQLPPLAVLFENARKSPAVEFFNIRKQEQESVLKTEKRSWMKYFRGSASYQYGKSGVLSYSEDNLNLYQYSDIEQDLYSVGASVSIPLDDLFDRNNRIKRQKLEMQATEMEVERWHDEQKLRIVDAYTAAEQYLSVLKVKIEALTFANAQYTLAENDFINGQIDAHELSLRKNDQISVFVAYEETKGSLNNVLLRLEILSKTKIISK